MKVGVDEVVASFHAANLAIAAIKYCRQNGQYPDTVHELAPLFVPEIPIDPFDGNRMKMRSTEKQIVFYSVGKDEENKDASKENLGFILQRSSACSSSD